MVDSTYKMAIPNIKAAWADNDGIGDGDDDANMVLTFIFMLTWRPDEVSQAVPIHAMPTVPSKPPAFVDGGVLWGTLPKQK